MAFVVAGAVIGIGLAATEGLRFDGWLRLPEEQPLHLVGPNGEHAWLPLWALQPEVAAWAEYGIVSDTDGPIVRLERAPLDRVGFAFSFEAGGAWLNRLEPDGTNGGALFGFLGRVAIGGFPVPSFGLFLGMGTGIGEGAVEWRPYLEAQWLPLRLGRVHGGAWTSVGGAFGSGQGSDFSTFDGSAGVIGQLELTTRLALTLRAGLHIFPDPGAIDVLPEFALGFVVY